MNVDRTFFWAIFLKLEEENAENYIQSVTTEKQKYEKKKIPQDKCL